MLTIQCPKCGSVHTAVLDTPLCGTVASGGFVFWGICNEVNCRTQFHVAFNLTDPTVKELEKERYVKIS